MAGKLFLLRRRTPMVGDLRETDAVLKGAAQYESRLAPGTPKVFDGVIRFCDATAKLELTDDGAWLACAKCTRPHLPSWSSGLRGEAPTRPITGSECPLSDRPTRAGAGSDGCAYGWAAAKFLNAASQCAQDQRLTGVLQVGDGVALIARCPMCMPREA